MLWTALYFLVLLGLGCLFLFEWYFPPKILKSPYHSPSDATIDQSLPDEILEHVMTFLDCQTVLTCRSVSKHWKYQASKDRVLKEVLYAQIRRNRRSFAECLADPKINLEWLEYNGTESIENQIRDHAAAENFDAKLLELTGKSLAIIKSKLQLRQTVQEEWTHEFLLKVVGIRGYSDTSWDLQEKSTSYANLEMLGRMPRIKPRLRDRFYLFLDLYEYVYSIYKPARMLTIRRALQLPKIAGCIPTTWDMPPMFILYLFATLFHDYWTSALELGFSF